MCCEDSQPTPPSGDNKFTNTLADIMTKQQARGETYYPLEDQLKGSVQQFQTPEFAAQQEGLAAADVSKGFADQRAMQTQAMQSQGINPNDPRNLAMQRGTGIAQALATAGAVRGARDTARNTAFDTLAGVSGKGDAKIGQAIQAAGQGGNIYAMNVRNGLQQEQMDNQGMAGMGSMVGTGLSIAATVF